MSASNGVNVRERVSGFTDSITTRLRSVLQPAEGTSVRAIRNAVAGFEREVEQFLDTNERFQTEARRRRLIQQGRDLVDRITDVSVRTDADENILDRLKIRVESRLRDVQNLQLEDPTLFNRRT